MNKGIQIVPHASHDTESVSRFPFILDINPETVFLIVVIVE